MIRRTQSTTQGVSSAASSVYKRQSLGQALTTHICEDCIKYDGPGIILTLIHISEPNETREDLVCRPLLEKKNIPLPYRVISPSFLYKISLLFFNKLLSL